MNQPRKPVHGTKCKPQTNFVLYLTFRAVSILLFFWRSTGVSEARFCSGIICYFSVFLLPIMLLFGGQICFQEAIMLVNYATLWLLTPPLYPCNLYLLFASHFRLIYSGLSW